TKQDALASKPVNIKFTSPSGGLGNDQSLTPLDTGSALTFTPKTDVQLPAGTTITTSSVTAENGTGALSATDSGTITANGGGVGAAVTPTDGGHAIAPTLGISVGVNYVHNTVTAHVANATVTAQFATPSGPLPNDVTLEAKETASVSALTIGGA